MAHWPGPFAAAALLTALAPLWAQPVGKPAPAPALAPGAARVAVDPARIIEAMDVCRRAPPSRAEAFAYARQQGFVDLPPEVRVHVPVETLVRQDVRLRVESSMFADSSGSCTVYAPIAERYSYDALVAALTARLGQPGRQLDGERMSWQIDGRNIQASLRSNGLDIWVGFPAPTPEQAAAARAEREAGRAEDMARVAARVASQASPAADIAAAATLCVAAVADPGSLEREGWARGEGAGASYARPGNNARIFASARQCVVDAFGETADSFDVIRDAIRDQLRARFGRDVRLAASTGNAGSFSRGQGFIVGDRMGILSSERRITGLSIRFTVMSFR